MSFYLQNLQTNAKTNQRTDEEQNKNSFPTLEPKTDIAPYNEKWNSSLTDNDILKRANNMSAMAFSMYQFTKGNGTLRTTQDLFTQAEYFAEEANRLYKVLRQFSYQVSIFLDKTADLHHHINFVSSLIEGAR